VFVCVHYCWSVSGRMFVLGVFALWQVCKTHKYVTPQLIIFWSIFAFELLRRNIALCLVYIFVPFHHYTIIYFRYTLNTTSFVWVHYSLQLFANSIKSYRQNVSNVHASFFIYYYHIHFYHILYYNIISLFFSIYTIRYTHYM